MEEKRANEHESDPLIPSFTDTIGNGNDGEDAGPDSFTKETLEEIRSSVKKGSFVGAGLVVLNRTIFLLYAVFVSEAFGVDQSFIGFFFLTYAGLGIILGVFFTWVGDRYGFDFAIAGSFILPTIGMAVAIVSHHVITFSIGALLAAGTMGHTILMDSFLSKLSKIAELATHAIDSSVYSREFVPISLMYKVFALVATPILVGALYNANKSTPFIVSLFLAGAFGLMSFTFLVGDDDEIVRRTGFQDNVDESDTDSCDWWMILRVTLLSGAKFFVACGAYAVQGFYIWYMKKNFHVNPFYTAMQIGGAALLGFLTAGALRSMRKRTNFHALMLLGSGVTFGTSFALSLITSNFEIFRFEYTWGLMFLNGMGHVLCTVSISVLLIETSSKAFVSRTSRALGSLDITANGFGPFLFTVFGVNLFLFQSVMSLFSILFFCGFLAVSSLSTTKISSEFVYD